MSIGLLALVSFFVSIMIWPCVIICYNVIYVIYVSGKICFYLRNEVLKILWRYCGFCMCYRRAYIMFSISSITNLICTQDIKNIILQLFPLVSVLAHFGIDANDTTSL